MSARFRLLCIAGLLLVVVPARAAAQFTYVTGTVTNARTGTPIPNVRVEVYKSDRYDPHFPPTWDLVGAGVTGADGFYTAWLFSVGQYHYVGTTFTGSYTAERYNDKECRRACLPFAGTGITLTPGETRTGINFTLYPTGAADIVADFGPEHGLWMLRADNQWQQVHWFSSVAMTTGDLDGNHEDDLVVNFGPNVGVWAWMNHAAWRFIHPFSPSQMVTGDLDNNGRDDLVFVFPGLGVWRWVDNDAWNQVATEDASKLVIGRHETTSAGAELIADIPGSGLWAYKSNGTRRLIHSLNATTLLTTSAFNAVRGCCVTLGQYDVVASFDGYGLWAYVDDFFWRQLHEVTPKLTAVGYLDANNEADLIVDFGTPHGIWTGPSWTKIHEVSAQSIAAADRTTNAIDEIIIDFGPGYGLWQLANHSVTAWSRLHELSPVAFVTGQFH